jgi:hypothetical protein
MIMTCQFVVNRQEVRNKCRDNQGINVGIIRAC